MGEGQPATTTLWVTTVPIYNFQYVVVKIHCCMIGFNYYTCIFNATNYFTPAKCTGCIRKNETFVSFVGFKNLSQNPVD
jgi:hypothetical protein